MYKAITDQAEPQVGIGQTAGQHYHKLANQSWFGVPVDHTPLSVHACG